MVFSSTTFLFAFLPLLFISYFVAPTRSKNIVLLLASLLFYAWGETTYVLLMIASILVNYAFGLWIHRSQQGSGGRFALTIAVGANLLTLIVFKYAGFILENLNVIFGSNLLPIAQSIHLPIGISFFTFQAMSYLIDIHRRRGTVQKNPLTLGLYISLFPQLIAGPIVRYHDIASQLVSRTTSREDFAYGARRFTIGLGKKTLIANPLGETADQIFALPSSELPPEIAWLGLVCYTLQIYFDFSGYSDMAIGLGRMLGFRFLENFNYPYISQSIQEFWRRWHISLSNWFRDYLYIPLGGNRKGLSRTYINLLIVFVLCGLWHGASWNFLIWGLIHGFFLVLERCGAGTYITRLPRSARHLYVILVAMFAWIFFRAETLPDALGFLLALCGQGSGAHVLSDYLTNYLAIVMLAGVLGAAPLLPKMHALLHDRANFLQRSDAVKVWLSIGEVSVILTVFVLSAASLAAGTYNPFIYFRF